MKIRIRLTRNDGTVWDGAPERTVDVPDGLTAKDIDFLPYNLGLKAMEDLIELLTMKQKEDEPPRIEPIIGQECICPDGLGRVVSAHENDHGWIGVSTYINDRGCKWSPENIELIDPRKGVNARS
ncbi:MAG: hypothetical protein V3W44_09960 [Dehalococcoidales bacterium]